jgi:hypothetical protein
MNISIQKNNSIVHTHPSPNSSAVKLDSLSQATISNFSMSGKKWIQKIVGSILYYTHAVDMTVLMALSTIAMLQRHPTKNTRTCCVQLLDYLATHADAKGVD